MYTANYKNDSAICKIDFRQGGIFF